MSVPPAVGNISLAVDAYKNLWAEAYTQAFRRAWRATFVYTRSADGGSMGNNLTIGGNTNVSGSSLIGTNISSSYHAQPAIPPEMWSELIMLAGKHGGVVNVTQALQLQQLIRDGKQEEAKPLWREVKSFLSGLLQHSANLAQIIGTIDAVVKHAS